MAGTSTIFRTNTPIDFRQVDGVYIDERTPPGPIVGVGFNKVCVVGEFEKGPVDVVTRIPNSDTFRRIFGSVGPDASGAFYKGGLAVRNKQFAGLHVIRISNGTQVTATVSLEDASMVDVLKIDADSPGVWGNSVEVRIEAASSGVANEFNLIVSRNGVDQEIFRNLDLADYADSESLGLDSDFIVATRIAIGDGRPVNVGATSLATGADGSFADADYTGSVGDVRGLQLLYGTQHNGIRWVFVAENAAAGVKAAMFTLCTTNRTKVGIVDLGAGDLDAAVTDVASYRSDRMRFIFNRPKTYIAEANGGQGGLVQVSPTSFAAAAFAALPPGRNPAGSQGEPFMTGISDLEYPNLGWEDYKSARESGIMALQFTQERNAYGIRSGITTSLQQGLINHARNTIADYIGESIAGRMVSFQNAPLTADNKLMMQSLIADFLDFEIQQGRLPSKQDVNTGRAEGEPELEPYEVDIDSGNTAASEAQGIFVIIVKVRSYASADFIVIRTLIGEQIEILAA